MIKQLYIFFKDQNADSKFLRHIQYNVQKNLVVEYVKYKRIDIAVLATSSEPEVVVNWNDQKTALIDCYAPETVLKDPSTQANIQLLYEIVYKGILEIWKSNQWNIDDIKEAFELMKRDYSFVPVVYGKMHKAPKGKLKAHFFCEVYPEYSNYYLDIHGIEGGGFKRIFFLKGTPMLELFFLFFTNAHWKDAENFVLSDSNKEIFYIFRIPEQAFSIEFFPKYNSLEQCKNYVRSFDADVSREEGLILMGLPAN